jgi:hypothetical protein
MDSFAAVLQTPGYSRMYGIEGELTSCVNK